MTVRVDGTNPPALALRNEVGRWSLPIGERTVELRRIRNLDVARNELLRAGRSLPLASAAHTQRGRGSTGIHFVTLRDARKLRRLSHRKTSNVFGRH